jgi:hypothetical protein
MGRHPKERPPQSAVDPNDVTGFKSPGAGIRTTKGLRMDPAQEFSVEAVRARFAAATGGPFSFAAAARYLLDLGIRADRERYAPGASAENARLRVEVPSPPPFQVVRITASADARYEIAKTDEWVQAPFEGGPVAVARAGCFAWRVPDDAMSPTFAVGDLVLVDPVGAPRQKDNVLVVTGGEVLLRQWVATPRGIVLLSPNEEVLPTPVPRPQDARVVGRVVSSGLRSSADARPSGPPET